MTILPKKKVQQEKRGAESGENQHHGHNSHHHLAHNLGHSVSHSTGESRGGARPKSRNSPPRWNTNNQRDDRLSNHDSRTSYESQERRENSHGGHSSTKRARHRSSPQHEYGDFEYEHAGVSWAKNSSATSQTEMRGSSPRESDRDGDVDAVNSGDEHEDNAQESENIEEIEERFARALKEKKGFIIKIMVPDGACLFRSVADQVYGDQDWHAIVRGHCMDYMTKNADYFSQFITEDFPTYITRKRLDSCHGNHVEMQALSEMYNRNIEVYMYSTEPINTFHTLNKTDNDPIRVSYHRNVHYNSVVNPHKATVGVGLGMPSFVPGLADKTLMREAIHISEKSAIEQTMLQDKLLATDWEATNEAIQEQVARESFVQWLKDNEKRAQKKALPATATCSSAPPDSPPGWWGESNQKSGGSQAGHHSGGKHPSGKHPNGKHSSGHHSASGHHPSGHLVPPHHQSGHLGATHHASSHPVGPHHPSAHLGNSHHPNSHLMGSHHPSGRLSPRNRGTGSTSRPNSPERLEAARLRPLSPNSIRCRNAEKMKAQQQQAALSKADRPTTSGHISNPASPQGALARDTASPKAGPSGYNPPMASHGTGDRMQDIPPEEFGISEWESEDAILASILAQSHQEYLDTLIRSTHKDTDSDS